MRTQLTISIDESQETEIQEQIDKRQDFRIDGGTLRDSDGKLVVLKGITFNFFPGSWTGESVRS